MVSLGREPQVSSVEKFPQPRSGGRYAGRGPAAWYSSKKPSDETLEQDNPDRNQVIWKIVLRAVKRRSLLPRSETE